MILTPEKIPTILALLDALADETRETLIAMREASGDPGEGSHLEALLKEYACIRDGRPMEDAIIYPIDLESLTLAPTMLAEATE